MLSSRYPSTLYRAGWFFTGYSKANLFFPELLQEKGIRTLGVHAHLYFGRGKGLEQGFDEWHIVPGVIFDPNTDKGITSPKTTARAIELLGEPENTGKPFFAWLHYMDPHDEYNKHPESPDFGSKSRDRYDSEVFFADLHFGKLLDWARQQPWWSKTAVVVSGDHGEAFGDHGMYKHAFELWDVLVRVPLLFRLPGVGARRIDVPRSQLDLAPTIVELMGVPASDSFLGRSLVRELHGVEAPEPREPLVMELAEDSHNPPRRAILGGGYKLIVYGDAWKTMLFDLNADPGEQRDLARTEPAKLAEMKALFDRTFKAVPSIAPYGGMKLKAGGRSDGPMGPPK
jgi:arylsulfatase A-like enzyme